MAIIVTLSRVISFSHHRHPHRRRLLSSHFICTSQSSFANYQSTTVNTQTMKPFKLFFLLTTVLTFTKSVSADSNDTEKLASVSRPLCPVSCSCFQINDTLADGPKGWQMVCTSIGLSGLPSTKNFSRPAYGLSIDYNNLGQLSILENLTELRELDASHNSIKEIEPRAFSATPNLVILNLSYNQLTNLPSDIFAPLIHLKVLHLTGNSLKSLPKSLLSSQSELVRLSLGKNFITRLELGIFDSVHRLKTLDLSENELVTLPPTLFTENLILNELDLSANSFTRLPVESLQGLTSLRSLIIDGNPLKVLDYRTLPVLSNLEVLSIRQMPYLRSIEQYVFHGLCTLKRLYLSDNRHLGRIDPDAFLGLYQFDNCSNLREIDLSNNKLTKLPQYALPWCSLDTVDLYNNPWQCDCDLKWLRECNHLVKSDIRCNQPIELNQRKLVDVDSRAFICSSDERLEYEDRIRRFLVMIIALISLFLVGMVIALFIQRPLIMDWFYGRKSGIGSIYYVKAPIHMTEY